MSPLKPVIGPDRMCRKMRVFRIPEFLGVALMLALLATLLRFVSGSL